MATTAHAQTARGPYSTHGAASQVLGRRWLCIRASALSTRGGQVRCTTTAPPLAYGAPVRGVVRSVGPLGHGGLRRRARPRRRSRLSQQRGLAACDDSAPRAPSPSGARRGQPEGATSGASHACGGSSATTAPSAYCPRGGVVADCRWCLQVLYARWVRVHGGRPGVSEGVRLRRGDPRTARRARQLPPRRARLSQRLRDAERGATPVPVPLCGPVLEGDLHSV